MFDLDGVLIDSEELWDSTRRALAADAGRPWPEQATSGMLGMSTAEWSAYLVQTVGLAGPPESVAATVIDRMADRYVERLPLLPGAVAAVRRLGALWPLGLASSSPRRLIDAVLHATDLASAFGVTVSTEEVEAGKPSPAVYHCAVDRLGAAPSCTVAIEDSSNGLRSAAGAGLRVIAIPHHAFPPAADALALASTVVHGLDDVSTELVESLAVR